MMVLKINLNLMIQMMTIYIDTPTAESFPNEDYQLTNRKRKFFWQVQLKKE